MRESLKLPIRIRGWRFRKGRRTFQLIFPCVSFELSPPRCQVSLGRWGGGAHGLGGCRGQLDRLDARLRFAGHHGEARGIESVSAGDIHVVSKISGWFKIRRLSANDLEGGIAGMSTCTSPPVRNTGAGPKRKRDRSEGWNGRDIGEERARE